MKTTKAQLSLIVLLGAVLGASLYHLAMGIQEARELAAWGDIIKPPDTLEEASQVQISYAQNAEDLISAKVLTIAGVSKPTYLDIGAAHPIKGNNTFYFYRQGSRGVLVEPNPFYVKMYQKYRPEDTALAAGIGTDDVAEADYYLVGNQTDGQWNTFSKDAAMLAEKTTNGSVRIQRVVKMPLLNINGVIEKYFGGKAPDFISIDVEGLEIPILKSLDFKKYRPAVICVETMTFYAINTPVETAQLMHGVGYTIRGMNAANLVFVANERLNIKPLPPGFRLGASAEPNANPL